MLREYDSIDPIILSGAFFSISAMHLKNSVSSVGENEEVSIKQVADAIVKAVGFDGTYQVGSLVVFHGLTIIG